MALGEPSMQGFHGARRDALSRIEILVICGIILILLLLLLPPLGKAHRGSYRVSCANNLKQIGLALHNYADMHPRKQNSTSIDLQFPAATIVSSSHEPDERLSWLVEILPFLEEDALYRQFDQSVGWQANPNSALSHTFISVVQCPAWKREFQNANVWDTPYIGVAGIGLDAARLPLGAANIGAFGYDRRVAVSDVKDGTSHTLMILESARATGPWANGGFTTVRGLDADDRPYLGQGRQFGGTHITESSLFKRGHSIGCNALMMDGSVEFLSDNTSPEVLEALATIAGGEKIPLDF
jgi:hypothetical protein